MRRRDFVLGAAGLAFLPAAMANPRLDSLTSGLPRLGSGEFRRWGFLVYEATLWAKIDDLQNPPLALALTYKRNLDGAKIADASVTEIRNLNIASEAQLKAWGERMTQIFLDVKAEDCIVGLHLPGGAKFFTTIASSAVSTTRPLPVHFLASGWIQEPAPRSCVPC